MAGSRFISVVKATLASLVSADIRFVDSGHFALETLAAEIGGHA